MNLISYDEQIYLLCYWLRTNLVDKTINEVERQLYLEFEVTDKQAIDTIKELLKETGEFS